MTGHTPIALRYDLTDHDMARLKRGHPLADIVRDILHEGDPEAPLYPGILCVESKNKYGEVIKTHLHYNFWYFGSEDETTKFCAKIRRRMQRGNACLPEKRGKGYYSIVAHPDIDFDRFFRYPMKQLESEYICEGVPFPDKVSPFDVEVQRLIAKDEWHRDLEFHNAQRHKAEQRQTTLERLVDSIATRKLSFKTQRQVFDTVIQFYRDEGLVMERMKIRGMVDTLSVRYGLITPDEFYTLCMN